MAVIAWIYNYLCNRCLSSLMLWVRLTLRVRRTTFCDKVCQWLAAVRWLSQGTPVSSNKTDRHDMYMLSGSELIDTENISLTSQNMKFVSFIFCRASWYFSVSIIFTDTVNISRKTVDTEYTYYSWCMTSTDIVKWRKRNDYENFEKGMIMKILKKGG